jgi:hypothetical protein
MTGEHKQVSKSLFNKMPGYNPFSRNKAKNHAKSDFSPCRAVNILG